MTEPSLILLETKTTSGKHTRGIKISAVEGGGRNGLSIRRLRTNQHNAIAFFEEQRELRRREAEGLLR